MSRRYVRGHVDRARAISDEPDSPIPFVFATEGQKEDGLDLRMDRIDLERFRANPIFGYGHDYFGRQDLPIGRATRDWVDGGSWMGEVEFDQDDDFARQVERKFRAGFLNAVSIGFDLRDIDRAGVPAWWAPFEVSAVPLPMDPDATVNDGRTLALARALAEAREGKVLSQANQDLVQQAIEALQQLASAADDGRVAPEPPRPLLMAARRRRAGGA